MRSDFRSQITLQVGGAGRGTLEEIDGTGTFGLCVVCPRFPDQPLYLGVGFSQRRDFGNILPPSLKVVGKIDFEDGTIVNDFSAAHSCFRCF